MQYPIVYDKFESSFDNLGLAVLEQAKNVKVSRKVNGEFTLSLWLPRNDPKWQHIQSENYIMVEGQLFRIKTMEEQRDSSGKLTSNIQCLHVWYAASDCKFMPSVEYIGMTPNAILQDVFSDTDFNVYSEIATLTDIWDSKSNPAKILSKLIENVGGELEINNWSIVHKAQIGQNKGVQFRIGKNVTDVKRTTDTRNIITRLWPLGKNGLQIDSVNGGVPYLDSPHIGEYDYIHIGYIEYKDIEDPEELMQAGQKEFTENHIDEPKVSYQFGVVELRKLTEYGVLEAFDIGDTIKGIDEGLGIDTLQRIIEYEYYPYEAQKSSVVLANSMDGLVNIVVQLVQGNNKLNNVLDYKDKVKGIADNAIGENQLVDLSVTYQKLGDASVTTRALANQAVDTSKLAELAVTTAQLANGSITTPKLGDAAVEAQNIKEKAVTGTKIDDAAIGTAHIQDGAIVNAKIVNGAIDNAKIADATITSAKIANAAVGSAAIALAAIGSAHIAEGVILNAHIGNAQIDDAKINNLAVEKLTGTYITGKTIRTAADGPRIELKADGFTVYNDLGHKNGPYISAYDNSFSMFDDDTPTLLIQSLGNQQGHRISAAFGDYLYLGSQYEYLRMEGSEIKADTSLLNLNSTGNIKLESTGGYINLKANNIYANNYAVATHLDLENYALKSFVGQNYATLASIYDMATETWVNTRGFLTSSALSGYATQYWVNNQNYATQNQLFGLPGWTLSWNPATKQLSLLNGNFQVNSTVTLI